MGDLMSQNVTATDLDSFRAHVREFIDEFAPAVPARAGVRSAEDAAELQALQEWTRRLYEHGYAGADWPEEYGGRPEQGPKHAIIVGEKLPVLRYRSAGRRVAGGTRTDLIR